MASVIFTKNEVTALATSSARIGKSGLASGIENVVKKKVLKAAIEVPPQFLK